MHFIEAGQAADGLERPVQFGEIIDLRQRWFPLSHSLGEIVYSLPLAPCESVNLAVIDWSRTDVAVRTDNISAREQLLHRQRRDRSIEETIDASIRETQGGWSLLGGIGAVIPDTPVAIAVGGALTNSWGNRELDASDLQELNDTIVQSSSVVRNLQSTVIVQATQIESNVVQTRTVTNHNHCHSLTIQYYQVLRNFKITTEYVGRRAAVLVPHPFLKVERAEVLRFRTTLEAALLDPALKPHFDALVRLQIGDLAYETPLKLDKPTIEPETGAGETYFSGNFKDTVQANAVMDTGKLIEKDSSVQVVATSEGIKFSIDAGVGYGPGGDVKTADQRFPGKDLHEYALLAQVGSTFHEVGAGATFSATEDGTLRFQFNDFFLTDNSGSAEVDVTVTRPSKAPEPEPGNDASKPTQPTKASDTVAEQVLLTHLKNNPGYYCRAIWLSMDPVDRRWLLEKILQAHPNVLATIDETPLGVNGNYVAFAYNSENPAEISRPAPCIDIVSLPVRGLFGEAQLGHCNACEKRDVTRFWHWEESPCERPPTIQGITPGPKGQTPDIQPTNLPSPVVQIMQPPAAPDPVGLAAAMNLLSQPNIFRDMSGLTEVRQLLSGLVSGAVGLEQARVLASQVQQKLSVATDGSRGPSPTTAPYEPDAARQVDRLDAIDYAREKGLITEADQRDLAKASLGGKIQPNVTLAGLPSAAPPVAAAALVKAVGDMSVEIVKNITAKFIAAPDLNMDKIVGGYTHLAGYPNATQYAKSPPSLEAPAPFNINRRIIRFDNLRGGAVLDGFIGRLDVSWIDDSYLTYSAMSDTDKKRVDQLQKIMCKSDINALPLGRVGGALSMVEVSLDLAVDKNVQEWRPQEDIGGNFFLRPKVVLLITIKLTPKIVSGTVTQTFPIELDRMKGRVINYIVQDSDGTSEEAFDLLQFGEYMPTYNL